MPDFRAVYEHRPAPNYSLRLRVPTGFYSSSCKWENGMTVVTVRLARRNRLFIVSFGKCGRVCVSCLHRYSGADSVTCLSMALVSFVSPVGTRSFIHHKTQIRLTSRRVQELPVHQAFLYAVETSRTCIDFQYVQ